MTQVDTSTDDAATSDAELITAVRAGDYAAFGALYERHAAAARAVARQYVRSGSDADDMVSEAFAKVLGILQAGGGPDVTFRAYLFTVVRRLSYDLSNAGRRTRPTDDIETFESAFGPMASTEDPTLEGFERSVVTKAYQGLPERWQAVLWYTEVEDMNPAQIAPLLGLTANGVSALAYRAREGLRQAYLQQHLTGTSNAGCESTNPLLGSYVRGGLAKRETAKVDLHLADCGECRALVLELGDVSHGMRAVIAPLVLGVGALGLVGTALPLSGGAAVGAGAGGATGAASGTGTGTAGASGSGAAAGSSSAAAGTSAGAAGTGAVGTGAVGGAATVGASSGLGAAAAVGAVGASAAVGTSAAAAAGATGLAAFIAASPLIAAAVGVVALAAVGAGVVAVSGGFSSGPSPSAGASPDPSASSSPSATPSQSPTGTPTPTPGSEPSEDPTSPANTTPLAEAPADTANASSTIAPGSAGPEVPVDVEPGPTTLAPPTAPLTPIPPFAPAPDPLVPVAPPAAASLDLAFTPLTLAPRAPQDLTLTASNSGGTSAEEVVVDVTLPANVSVVTSAVVAGRGTAPVIRLAALPCGPASAQSDGSSLVTCSVGVLAPNERKELVITVQASRGGTYTFGGAVHGKGLDRVAKEYVPAPVPSYGAEIDLTTPVVGDLLNPGATSVRLTARNSGDVDARGVSFVVDNLPDGVTAGTRAPGWSCEPGGGSLTCTNDAADLPAPVGSAGYGAPVVLDVQLLAGDGAPTSTTPLAFSASTRADGEPLKDSATADLSVGEPWAGADRAPADTAFAARCVDDVATVVLKGVANATAYDDLRVTLAVDDVTSQAVSVPRGTSAQLEVPHDLRVPEGASASLRLVTAVDGREFTREVPVSGVPAKDCFDPQWLSASDVTTHAANETGTVRLEAVVANSTGRPLTVQVEDMMLAGAEEASRGTATIDPGESATFFRSTGEQVLASADLVVRQHLSVPDADGDPGEYDQQLTVDHAAARIAPSSPVPAVGECLYVPETRTSSAPVTLTFDNSASTLPVVFSVAGQDPVEVEARTVATSTSTVGYQGATFVVLADGREVARHVVPGVSCYVPSWSREVSVVAENVGGQVRLTGTVVNTTDEAMDVRMLAPVGLGVKDSEKVTVEAGQSGSFVIDTGSRSVDAGEVTFRQYRWVVEAGSEGKGYTHSEKASFERAAIAPTAAVAAGQCVYDPAAHTSTSPVTLTFDNSASTLPVDFAVSGRDDLTQRVQPGERVPVKVTTGFQGATFTVLADGRQVANQAVPGVSCYVPDWSAQQSARSEVVAGAIRVVGSYTNTSKGTVQVLMKAANGEASADVPAGATRELVVAVSGSRLPAGAAEFRQSVTADGALRTNTVTARYEAARYDTYAPTVANPILGVCFFDKDQQKSYRPVTFVYDNMGSTAPVTFQVEVDGVLAPDTVREVANQKRLQLKVPNLPEAGATYRVSASSGQTWTFPVEGQTCLPAWKWTEWYDKGERVSYEGRNYIATGPSWGFPPPASLTWRLEGS